MKKFQNFANPTITATTYSGEAASGYVAAALLSAATLDNKYVTIMPNVKYKSVIQKLAVTGIVQDASCDFVTSGSVAISEQVLVPKELQVNLLLCKQEFVASWEALQLGYSAFDEIPKNFNDFLISYVGGKVAEATEISIWQGTTATNGEFGGFQNALSSSIAAGGATAVLAARTNGGTTAIISGSVDSSNVIAKLTGVFQTIPTTVYGKQDLLMYVSTNVARAYQGALAGGGASGLGANGFNNQLNVGEKPLNFNGIQMVMCPGMADNKIVAAQKSNLFFGTGLMSDYNEVKVIDMANIDGSQNYRIVMRYTGGTQFGVGQDIVYYGAY
ncbi:hypothetical protein UFOVP1475_25 [uncultured Caudovirales phage]|jgi:hypothetical protein|uniref:Uncharacterized protein n=1 Tax=uncultured Caudovirales phage TaxID=2100421 RepID=A0A6J5SLC1_9CAUD|nr:hypothetical protein UFOVP1475_25 [uncultured Caudovirales phage]